MAGGGGTRLWPLSRRAQPKQSQPFGDNQTLLQKTYGRIRQGWGNHDVFLSTSIKLAPFLRPQLPTLGPDHYILEPVGRETAAAIGLAAAVLHKRNPKEIVYTANSDHYMKDVPTYLRILRSAEKLVAKYPERTAMVGVEPRSPDTGLGYIKLGRFAGRIGRQRYYHVDRFVEKPDLKTAQQYLRSGRYLWNPAMFVFRVDAMLEKFRRWLPASYRILKLIEAAVDTPSEKQTIKRLFPKMQKISIDYGIMEHDRSMLVIPASFAWADIGTWRSVYDMLSGDPAANIVLGKHVSFDSQGNLIYGSRKKLIATAGLHDMIVVDTPDALLICPKHESQSVKQLVAEMTKQRHHRYL